MRLNGLREEPLLSLGGLTGFEKTHWMSQGRTWEPKHATGLLDFVLKLRGTSSLLASSNEVLVLVRGQSKARPRGDPK